MPRPSSPTLKPTLWRTCRVLANEKRLKMLDLLFHKKDLPVASVAEKLRLPVQVTSQYLRALAARGLIASRRNKRTVCHRPAADPSVRGTAELLRALRLALRRGVDPVDTIFRQATAFTHPRRIEMVRALARGPMDTDTLAKKTGISRSALYRHLDKLQRRGFIGESVGEEEGLWQLSRPHGPFAAALVRLASGR